MPHGNPRVIPGVQELRADAAIHLLGVGLGVPAALAVVAISAVDGTARALAAAILYATGLLAMLGFSAAYNVLHAHRRRDWLQRLDHAAIFAMIAGTYTPFTLLLERGWAAGLTAAIWTLAVTGMVLKLWRPRRIGRLSVILYLALGWIGLVAIGPLTSAIAPPTLLLLAVGGVLYTVGVVFHLWQRLPYNDAIWHVFVLAAAGVHYVAVLGTLWV